MLKDLNMADGRWPEAHEYLNYVRNCTPTTALKQKTPYEAFHGKKPDVGALHVFGSRCHIHIPKEKCGKLDTHSVDGIFCSFALKSKAYKIWVPSHHKFITSRDVIVYEKLPEHEDELIITITPSEGVSQDQNALSKGSTEPTNNISASNSKAILEQELPTTLKPTPTVETQHQPIQLCRSERAT